jgi:hypothetical protein
MTCECLPHRRERDLAVRRGVRRHKPQPWDVRRAA